MGILPLLVKPVKESLAKLVVLNELKDLCKEMSIPIADMAGKRLRVSFDFACMLYSIWSRSEADLLRQGAKAEPKELWALKTALKQVIRLVELFKKAESDGLIRQVVFVFLCEVPDKNFPRVKLRDPRKGDKRELCRVLLALAGQRKKGRQGSVPMRRIMNALRGFSVLKPETRYQVLLDYLGEELYQSAHAVPDADAFFYQYGERAAEYQIVVGGLFRSGDHGVVGCCASQCSSYCYAPCSRRC